MAGAKPATRLYMEAALAPGQAVGLDHAQAHFLRSVLRLAPGARLAVFNGRDGEWLAEVEGLGKGWCSLTLLERRRAPAPEPDLWLVFAPIKRSEEHTSELQSLMRISYAVFCLKKKQRN